MEDGLVVGLVLLADRVGLGQRGHHRVVVVATVVEPVEHGQADDEHSEPDNGEDGANDREGGLGSMGKDGEVEGAADGEAKVGKESEAIEQADCGTLRLLPLSALRRSRTMIAMARAAPAAR